MKIKTNISIGERLMEQLLALLRNEKLSGTVIVMFLITVWWIHGWAKEEFVDAADFQELKKIIVFHIDDMQIVNASQLIRDKELALQVCKATGKSTGQASPEMERLKREIAQAKAYRQCLIDERPNCKHLKPPE